MPKESFIHNDLLEHVRLDFVETINPNFLILGKIHKIYNN